MSRPGLRLQESQEQEDGRPARDRVIPSSPCTVRSQGGVSEGKDEFTVTCFFLSSVFQLFIRVVNSAKVFQCMQSLKYRAPKCKRRSEDGWTRSKRYFFYVETSFFHCFSPSNEFVKNRKQIPKNVFKCVQHPVLQVFDKMAINKRAKLDLTDCGPQNDRWSPTSWHL